MVKYWQVLNNNYNCIANKDNISALDTEIKY